MSNFNVRPDQPADEEILAAYLRQRQEFYQRVLGRSLYYAVRGAVSSYDDFKAALGAGRTLAPVADYHTARAARFDSATALLIDKLRVLLVDLHALDAGSGLLNLPRQAEPEEEPVGR